MRTERLQEIRHHTEQDDPREASEERFDLLTEVDRLRALIERTIAIARATSDPGGDCCYGDVMASLEDLDSPGTFDERVRENRQYYDERMLDVLNKFASDTKTTR